MTENRSRLLAAALLISLFAGFAVIAARAQGVLEPLEMIGYDLGLAFLKAPDAAPPITLLAISE
ncbi:MAG: hypothetical protein OES38_23610, partial [Gammaproteobacteria bacterium]|nr:hypothetical protein [Gammaproteobacteria bacterium]